MHIFTGNGVSDAVASDSAVAHVALRGAFGSLERGGLLLVHDIFSGPDGPLFPALFALNMLTHTEEGRTWKDHELLALMREAGFTDVRRLSLELSGGRGILAGVKA